MRAAKKGKKSLILFALSHQRNVEFAAGVMSNTQRTLEVSYFMSSDDDGIKFPSKFPLAKVGNENQ